MELFEAMVWLAVVVVLSGTAMFVLIREDDRRKAAIKWLSNIFWVIVGVLVVIGIILTSILALLSSLIEGG